MKKYLYLVLAVCLPMLVMSSCSKDDDNKDDDPVNPSSSLVGKWVSSDGYYLEFKDESNGIYYQPARDEWDEEEYEPFTYTFSASTGVIVMLFGDEYETATLSGNTVVFGKQVFTKQSDDPVTPTVSLIGKWINGYGQGFEFVSDSQGFTYESGYGEYDEEEYEAFAYKFTPSTGKITFLFGDEYEGALYKDNSIIVDGDVFVKVSSGPYSANVVGQWNASSGKELTFDNLSQGEYKKAEGQYEDFTYTYNASSGTITLIINKQKSTASFDGTKIKYNGETYENLATFPEHDEVLGMWCKETKYARMRLYFKTLTSGYYDDGNGNYDEFNYVFSSKTGTITLYFDDRTETATYKGEYILYKNNMYQL